MGFSRRKFSEYERCCWKSGDRSAQRRWNQPHHQLCPGANWDAPVSVSQPWLWAAEADFSPTRRKVGPLAMQRAYELGVRYFDTAYAYANGLSEARVGKALRNPGSSCGQTKEHGDHRHKSFRR